MWWTQSTVPIIKRGLVSIPGGSGSHTAESVVFDEPFPSPPTVMVTAVSAVVGSIVSGVGATGVTSEGFTAQILRTNATASNVAWLAVWTP